MDNHKDTAPPPRYTIVDEGMDPHLRTHIYRVRAINACGSYRDFAPVTSYAAAALMRYELELAASGLRAS